ncbi:putative NADH-dependent butanol dehydrogenase a [Monocercomonoides exilis]|uniref:putative NADH-dependent butanol dehydrogenase a n=1 Tax=Monocercomonoides exilis TaxID=2049356 RepID=UPI00355A87A8|nr:putative NADH-dependent butanol dehydrogenase a [Monocercomonoides exilis]|eukprot:MONOS_7429.1-p1 / transcript=MONOS_7429.1 / gene=MONOS_7429 / organism=Monocercomonoides_exilis_PA203 / gene_product=NADH-dependent butanol dehydrogenase a / transcript_product=NADH-dependent butanol dehydrogenase a / location=Mono_scaffold00253:52900-54136(+) / protein_length=390 / sequence_SO=supercontig / SO=protein_coding / is_pseudo=false
MQSQVYYNPTKVIFGSSSYEQLCEEIKKSGIKKLLIVFGKESAKITGVYDRIKKCLAMNGIADEELWGVQPNPLISKVREGIAICKDKTKCIEGVLAVGGGSVIDTSKAICFGSKMENDIWEIFCGMSLPPPEGLPLFVASTISMTGSGLNNSAVISNPESHSKLPSIFDYPKICAIDPTVEMSLPWRQVMCGAVDALSHLMENYFSMDNKNITTRQINLALQKSVIKSIERVKANKEDVEARANFCWAASLALSGLTVFGLSGDWNVHHIEHALSAFDEKIAHGEGLAVISLAYYPQLYAKDVCNEMFEEWALEVFGKKDVKEAFAMLRELYVYWGAPLTLQDLKVKPEDIEEIVKIEQEQQMLGAASDLWYLDEEDVKNILLASVAQK